MKTPISILTLVSFLLTGIIGPIPVNAQNYVLPAPGVMVHLSPPLEAPILKGIKVHPDNPFKFDFILDKGESEFSNEQLKSESSKLIKYFLASLTIPEKDLWVNLSPYEKDRIIPQSFGMTSMGRDLLAEDYMLKQITASLIYPEDEIGKKFWNRVYAEAEKKYGTTNIPVSTFNKVWIMPESAVVYENAKAGTAYIVDSKLKVMLEEDYLSLTKHEGIQSRQAQSKDTNQLGSQVVREIVIPELTREVNEGKNFARLRQVYNSLILAIWYKKKIKDSILAQVYSDKAKVAGISIDDPNEKQKIYQRYLQAFKKGVYNFIKEDTDPVTQQIIPRKYFSGGVQLWLTGFERYSHDLRDIKPQQAGRTFQVQEQMEFDFSMRATTKKAIEEKNRKDLEVAQRRFKYWDSRVPPWTDGEIEKIPQLIMALHNAGFSLRGDFIIHDTSPEGVVVVQKILGTPRTASSVYQRAVRFYREKGVKEPWLKALKVAGLDPEEILREPGYTELYRMFYPTLHLPWAGSFGPLLRNLDIQTRLNESEYTFDESARTGGLVIDKEINAPFKLGGANILFRFKGAIVRIFPIPKYDPAQEVANFRTFGNKGYSPKLLAAGRTKNGYSYIVVNEVDGDVLSSLEKLDEKQTDALISLCRNYTQERLVVNDFAPSNVMWDKATETMKIIDVELGRLQEKWTVEQFQDFFRRIYATYGWETLDQQGRIKAFIENLPNEIKFKDTAMVANTAHQLYLEINRKIDNGLALPLLLSVSSENISGFGLRVSDVSEYVRKKLIEQRKKEIIEKAESNNIDKPENQMKRFKEYYDFLLKNGKVHISAMSLIIEGIEKELSIGRTTYYLGMNMPFLKDTFTDQDKEDLKNEPWSDNKIKKFFEVKLSQYAQKTAEDRYQHLKQKELFLFSDQAMLTQRLQWSAAFYFAVNKLINNLTDPSESVRHKAQQGVVSLVLGKFIDPQDVRGKIDLSLLNPPAPAKVPETGLPVVPQVANTKVDLDALFKEINGASSLNRLKATQELAVMGLKGSISAEEIQGRMDLPTILSGLIDNRDYIRLGTAQVLRDLVRGKLVDLQDVRSQMDPTRLFNDLTAANETVSLMAIQSLAYLGQAGILHPETLFNSADLKDLFNQFDTLDWNYQAKILLAKSYFLLRGVNMPSSWKENMEILFRTLPAEDLNRANIEQLVSDAESRDAQFIRALLKQVTSKDFLENLKVSEIDFNDGGASISNFKNFMDTLFLYDLYRGPERPEGFPDRNAPQQQLEFTGQNVVVDNNPIDVMHPDEQFGRTLVYKLPEKGKVVYLKFLKKGEDPSNLSYEHDLMNFFNSKKDEWGLQGQYPTGRIALGRIPAGQVPSSSPANQNKQEAGKNIELAVDDQGNNVFMAYETELGADGNSDYMTYLNDPSLTHEEFMKGLRINVHDRLVMAAHGLFDMEIIELFHAQAQGGNRQYNWMVRDGAGRLNDVAGATLYPNIRLSGPADFPAIHYIGDLVKSNEAQGFADGRIFNILRSTHGDETKALPYITSALLGDTLLSLSLMPGTYLRSRGELSYEQESGEGASFLQNSMSTIFTEAYQAYTGMDSTGLEQGLNLNAPLMARQMSYFMSDKYVQDHRAGTPIPESLYPGAIIRNFHPGRGWKDSGGWDLREVQYTIPSRDKTRHQTQESYDLGPVNGPNPLQELMRTLFLVTPVMTDKLNIQDLTISASEPGTPDLAMNADVIKFREGSLEAEPVNPVEHQVIEGRLKALINGPVAAMSLEDLSRIAILDVKGFGLGIDNIEIMQEKGNGSGHVYCYLPQNNRLIATDHASVLKVLRMLTGNQMEDLMFKDKIEEESIDWSRWLKHPAYEQYRREVDPMIVDVVNLINAKLPSNQAVRVLDIFAGDGSLIQSIERGSHRSDLAYSYLEGEGKNVKSAQGKLKALVDNGRLKLNKATDIASMSAQDWKDSVPERPNIVTASGGLTSNVVENKQVAFSIAQHVYDILQPGGYFIVTGLTPVHLTAEDFGKIGFKVLNKSIPQNVFLNMPNEFYILQKAGPTMPAINPTESDIAMSINLSQLVKNGYSVRNFNGQQVLFTLRQSKQTVNYLVIDAYNLNSPKSDKIGYIVFSYSDSSHKAFLREQALQMNYTPVYTPSLAKRFNLQAGQQVDLFSPTEGLWVERKYRKKLQQGSDDMGSVLMSAALRLAQTRGVQEFFISTDDLNKDIYKLYRAHPRSIDDRRTSIEFDSVIDLAMNALPDVPAINPAVAVASQIRDLNQLASGREFAVVKRDEFDKTNETFSFVFQARVDHDLNYNFDHPEANLKTAGYKISALEGPYDKSLSRKVRFLVEIPIGPEIHQYVPGSFDGLVEFLDQKARRYVIESSMPDFNAFIKDLKEKIARLDTAMEATPGGIDLTQANLKLQSQNINGAVNFHVDTAMLQKLQNAQGIVPVIINVKPLNSLTEFLGLNLEPAENPDGTQVPIAKA